MGVKKGGSRDTALTEWQSENQSGLRNRKNGGEKWKKSRPKIYIPK